jgi:hypothetical protein
MQVSEDGMADLGMICEGNTYLRRRGEWHMFEIDPNVTTEIKQSDLIEVTGETGPFYVTTAGANLMFRDCYFYGDEGAQFFFYAVWEQRPDGSIRIVVHHATIRRMEGPMPTFPTTDAERIEANLMKLFTERDFRYLDRPADLFPAKTIEFTWEIRR